MNKETAHQLGTPISSLVAWVEYLKLNPENEMVCQELTKDIKGIKTITFRNEDIVRHPLVTKIVRAFEKEEQ